MTQNLESVLDKGQASGLSVADPINLFPHSERTCPVPQYEGTYYPVEDTSTTFQELCAELKANYDDLFLGTEQRTPDVLFCAKCYLQYSTQCCETLYLEDQDICLRERDEDLESLRRTMLAELASRRKVLDGDKEFDIPLCDMQLDSLTRSGRNSRKQRRIEEKRKSARLSALSYRLSEEDVFHDMALLHNASGRAAHHLASIQLNNMQPRRGSSHRRKMLT